MMMERTSITCKVFTACLVIYTGILIESASSLNCDPSAENTDLKAYRSPIVAEGFLNGTLASVLRKTLKGEQFSKRITQIQVRGFESENPCIGPASSFSQGTKYMLFLNQTDPGNYSLVGNPVKTSGSRKRDVRKVEKEGGPPVLKKRLRPKYMQAGERLTLTCAGKGMPTPLMYWLKDGRRLNSDHTIPRLKIKPTKRNVKLSIRNLDEALHEGTYTCVVTNTVDPPVTTSSTLSICAITCANGELQLKKCKCNCNDGYSGDFCEIADDVTDTPPLPTPTTCTLDCGLNGRLSTDSCSCSCLPGFEGTTCSDVVSTGSPVPCALDCGDQGTLDPIRCQCDCNTGYSGELCTNDDWALCLEGTYCQNGGTCELPTSDATQPVCRCPTEFKGKHCELNNTCPGVVCENGGTLREEYCACDCPPRYTGTSCSGRTDNHTKPCTEEWDGYCLHNGICNLIVGVGKPSCKCPENKRGERCDISILEPNTCTPGYCLNNGTCRYSAKKDKRRCICPELYRGSPRCEFLNNNVYSKAPPVVHPSIEQNSMKVIITLTVIFISLLLVLLLVVFVYIKNRNYQAERRRVHRNPLRPKPTFNSPLHHNSNNLRVNSSQIVELEMEPRRPSAPPAVMRAENEDSLHRTKAGPRSHSVDVRYTSLPLQAKPTVTRTMHNGHARKISQTSLNSNRSTTSHPSNPSTPISASGKRHKLGYEAVPMSEPVESRGYRGDRAACEDASILMIMRQDDCSDTESECSSRADDIVDVPNPQIRAIESHLALPGDEFDDSIETDLSADVVNANVHLTNPYAHAPSPMHTSPLLGRHMHTGGPPQEVHLHENPLAGGDSLQHPAQDSGNELDHNGYYTSNYEDEIDRSSPPHAV